LDDEWNGNLKARHEPIVVADILPVQQQLRASAM
jgi:hypothetical protein